MGREIPAERRIRRCACARVWARRTGPRVLARLTRASVLRFDDNGIAYSYDGASTVVPWTDISAVGIAFEIPVDIPSINLSGILADKLVDDVLKVNKSRKISLEIFPTLRETLDQHPVLANFRQNLRPPTDGLGTGIWRMTFPSPRLARRVARGPQKYAPQLYLGWYRRPWSGSILGRPRPRSRLHRPTPLAPPRSDPRRPAGRPAPTVLVTKRFVARHAPVRLRQTS